VKSIFFALVGLTPIAASAQYITVCSASCVTTLESGNKTISPRIGIAKTIEEAKDKITYTCSTNEFVQKEILYAMNDRGGKVEYHTGSTVPDHLCSTTELDPSSN